MSTKSGEDQLSALAEFGSPVRFCKAVALSLDFEPAECRIALNSCCRNAKTCILPNFTYDQCPHFNLSGDISEPLALGSRCSCCDYMTQIMRTQRGNMTCFILDAGIKPWLDRQLAAQRWHRK